MTPNVGPNDADTAITLVGSFELDIQISYRAGGRSRIDDTFRVRIGDVDALGVTYVDSDTLEASVPAGMAVGWHDVLVSSPSGSSATLIDGFQIFAANVTTCTSDAQCNDSCYSVASCANGTCAYGTADKDADGDGHVDANCSGGDDCDDSCAACWTGAVELCDGFDNDCDPATTEGSQDPLWVRACDGPDADSCLDDTYVSCDSATGMVCSTGADNDCTDGWQDLGNSAGGVPSSVHLCPNDVVNTVGESKAPVAVSDPSTGGLLIAWEQWVGGVRQIGVAGFDGTTWTDFGGSFIGAGLGDPALDSKNPSIAIDASGAPVVAWEQKTGAGDDIFVARWSGTAWVGYAGGPGGDNVSNNGTKSAFPALGVDDAGTPFVAWEQDVASGAKQVWLRTYDAGWVGIGGSDSGQGLTQTANDSRAPTLAMMLDGWPAVAWEDDDTAQKDILVRYYDGVGAWQAYAAGANVSNTTGTDSTRPSLALIGGTTPVLVWEEKLGGANKKEIWLRQLSGTAWVAFGTSGSGGGISNTADDSRDPVVSLDGNDNPVVAWWEDVGGQRGEIHVEGWDPVLGQWAPLDSSGGSVSGQLGASQRPTLVLVGGQAYVGWEDIGQQRVALARLVVAVWEPVRETLPCATTVDAGLSNTPLDGTRPSVAFGPDGNPVVAWEQEAGGKSEIYVSRWTGTQWLGYLGSDSGGGISNTPGDNSTRPRIVVDSAGNPVVAWEENIGGQPRQIYLLRWDPGTPGWLPLGPSGGGSGLSQTVGNSARPALALDPRNDAPVVAWQEARGNDQIYLLAWDPTASSGAGDWLELDGSATADGVSQTPPTDSRKPVLAVDAAGDPTLAWEEDDGNWQIFARHLVAGVWTDFGGARAVTQSADDSQAPALVLDTSGDPVIAWEEKEGGSREVHVARYNGGWQGLGISMNLGGITNTASNSKAPAIAIDPVSLQPVVAWEAITSGFWQIFVLRFDDVSGAWVEVGPSSASGGGISNTASTSRQPTLACSSVTNRCACAWEEGLGASRDIWLRVWP